MCGRVYMNSCSAVPVVRGAGQGGRGGWIAVSGMIVAVCAHNRHRTLNMEAVRSTGPLGGAFLKPRPMDVVDYCAFWGIAFRVTLPPSNPGSREHFVGGR